jgi:hypothetical protein
MDLSKIRQNSFLKHLLEIFDDWLTRVAGIIFIVILVLVIFNITSGLYQAHPLLGLFAFSLVPLLFFAGGVVFVLAILKQGREGQ